MRAGMTSGEGLSRSAGFPSETGALNPDTTLSVTCASGALPAGWFSSIRSSHRARLMEFERKQARKRALPVTPLQYWSYGLSVAALVAMMAYAGAVL